MIATLDIAGRDRELAALRQFTTGRNETNALVLEGDAGIGKTTLWSAAVDEARAAGARVLTARPAEAERGLAHAALEDLLGGVLDDVLPSLTAPRRNALEVALLRDDNDEHDPVDARAVGVAVRDALQLLLSQETLLVAIDDVQWLDAATSAAVAFALRRLSSPTFRVLLARRTGEDATLDQVEEAVAPFARRVTVGPLSAGALHSMLHDRLGIALPRQTLLRVHEHSGGNPYFALEIARALDPAADPFEPLSIPHTLEDLLRARLTDLSAPTRDVLALVAALGQVRDDQLATAGVPRDLLDPAFDASVLVREGALIRFAHPLLAAVVAAPPGARRREVHGRAAAIANDPVARARHIALATDDPDAAVAGALDDAARMSAARGAPATSAELSEHAARLTPADAADLRRRRELAAARFHARAGEWTRARTVATEVAASEALPALRAEALMLLSEFEPVDRSIELLEMALGEARGDAAMQATIECRLAWACRFAEGVPHAEAALALAEDVGDDELRTQARAVHTVLSWFAGDPEAACVLPTIAPRLSDALGGPNLVREATQSIANTLAPASTRDDARLLLETEHREWRERDEPRAAQARWGLAWLEFWAGRWDEAAEHARAAHDVAIQYGREVPQDHLPLAVIEVHRGRLAAAKAHSQRALELAEQDFGFHPPQHLAVLALVAVGEGDPTTALQWFERAQARALELGWREPTVRWWTGDHAELLLELGKMDDALVLVDAWERDAHAVGRGWVLPHAGRCRALAAAANGQIAAALDTLDAARRTHEVLGDPFGSARALLTLGGIRRRARQKRPAREALEAAAAAFAEIGASGWAEKASAELGRISGRVRSTELTPAERRVAELVAAGKTNREVAAALFLGERTVASHLNRIYSKVGVRSRTELAVRLRDGA